MDIVSDSFMDSSSSLASLASWAMSVANSEPPAAGSVVGEGDGWAGGCGEGVGEPGSQLLLALSPLVAALEVQCCWQQWGLQQQQAPLLLLHDKRWAAGCLGGIAARLTVAPWLGQHRYAGIAHACPLMTLLLVD